MFKTLKEWYYGTKCHLILASYLELVLVYLRIRKEADFVKDRKAICKICNHSRKTLFMRWCTVCSCIIQAKAVKEYSTCPKKRWLK